MFEVKAALLTAKEYYHHFYTIVLYIAGIESMHAWLYCLACLPFVLLCLLLGMMSVEAEKQQAVKWRRRRIVYDMERMEGSEKALSKSRL